jgi:hypothetical protein
MNLTACMIFWNDTPEMLERSMRAVRDNGFSIVAVDGAYREMMAVAGIKDPTSTDGCLDIASKYAESLVLSPSTGWKSEADKRQACLRHVHVDEYFIISDADEVLRPMMLDTVVKDDAARMIEVLHLADGRTAERPLVRMWRRFQDLGYRYQHCRLYHTSQMDEKDINAGLVSRASSSINLKYPILKNADGTQVKFDHFPHTRPIDRQMIKGRYYCERSENQYPF